MSTISTAAPSAGRRRRQRSYSFNRMSAAEVTTRYVLLLVVLLVTVGPFLWELSTSLKGANENIYTTTPQFIPQHPTLSNYKAVNQTVPVLHYALNSVIVAALTILGNVVGATLAGYALARIRWWFAKVVLLLIIATMLLPGEATLVAQFLTVRSLGFADSLVGVALPGMIGMVNVLLMRTAFLAVPGELDEAARIDGASTWQRLLHVALPGVKGMLSVIAIFAFIGAWDDFLWPLIILNDPSKLTLTVGLNYLSGAFSTNPRVIAAGTMISFIPILIVFVALQRYFFRGVEEGAIKG